MPTVEFYAVQADTAKLLEFVSAETDCRLYEAYSVPGQPLREFTSAAEALAAYPLDHGERRVSRAQFFLWSPSTGPEPVRRRIELRPGVAEGATHRFTLEGWGLIQLLAGGVRERRIERSRIAHNSEARARAWESTDADRSGPVDAWDWKALDRLAGRLVYHVRRRLAADKHGSSPVLPGAQARRASGFELA